MAATKAAYRSPLLGVLSGLRGLWLSWLACLLRTERGSEAAPQGAASQHSPRNENRLGRVRYCGVLSVLRWVRFLTDVHGICLTLTSGAAWALSDMLT